MKYEEIIQILKDERITLRDIVEFKSENSFIPKSLGNIEVIDVNKFCKMVIFKIESNNKIHEIKTNISGELKNVWTGLGLEERVVWNKIEKLLL